MNCGRNRRWEPADHWPARLRPGYLLLASSYCRLSLTFSAKFDLLLAPIW